MTTIQSVEQVLFAAIDANPNDAAPHFALADWYEEQGETGAAHCRRVAAEQLVKKNRDREEMAEKVTVEFDAEFNDSCGEVWTRERVAIGEKSYDARKAAEIFASHPDARRVVISSDAPTKRNLEYASKSTRGQSVLYYRKSSGGKWARSAALRAVKIK